MLDNKLLIVKLDTISFNTFAFSIVLFVNLLLFANIEFDVILVATILLLVIFEFKILDNVLFVDKTDDVITANELKLPVEILSDIKFENAAQLINASKKP